MSGGKVRLSMSMSVDGFIIGPDDGPEHGLGVDGERLHAWLRDGGVDPVSHRPADGTNAEVFDEMMATGAVITGRHTFDYASGWAGDHHDGVPVFVLTRSAPDGPAPGHARYVTEVESRVRAAKAAVSTTDMKPPTGVGPPSARRRTLRRWPTDLRQGRYRTPSTAPPRAISGDARRCDGAVRLEHAIDPCRGSLVPPSRG